MRKKQAGRQYTQCKNHEKQCITCDNNGKHNSFEAGINSIRPMLYVAVCLCVVIALHRNYMKTGTTKTICVEQGA